MPKRPRCLRTGKLLGIREYLKRTYETEEFWPLWEDGLGQAQKLGIEYLSNTSEEILTSANEFLLRQQGQYQEDEEEITLRTKFFEIVDKVPGPYRFFTPISTSFLRMNSYLLDS